MNTLEREKLTDFLQQLVDACAGRKDIEAEELIRDAIARQPDAAYLLVQKVLLLERALRNAQAQIEQLRDASTQNHSSFMDNNAWGASTSRPAMATPTPGPASVQNSSAPGSSWIGNVATTAAGVVAGSFLFQGIEHLLGHHDPSLSAHALSSASGDTAVANNFFDDAPTNSFSTPDSSLDSLALSVDDYETDRWE